MRIDEILSSGARMRARTHSSHPEAGDREPVFSFELFPPKTAEGESNLRAALSELSELDPAFVSVTYGAGGSTRERTIEIVKSIRREYDLEAMAHLTCVGAGVEQLRATVSEMADSGIENILALRGDAPQDAPGWRTAPDGLVHAFELIELVRSEHDLALGAACFPETHPEATSPAEDIEHLRAKVQAGASFLITQLFFDNGAYFDFLARARAAGIEVPIIPGIMPITQVGQVKRMAQMCGASIPERLQAELAARSEQPEAVLDFGVAYATLQCSELLAAGAPGIHFYTLNRSPATRAILSALRIARPWAAGDRRGSVRASMTAAQASGEGVSLGA